MLFPSHDGSHWLSRGMPSDYKNLDIWRVPLSKNSSPAIDVLKNYSERRQKEVQERVAQWMHISLSDVHTTDELQIEFKCACNDEYYFIIGPEAAVKREVNSGRFTEVRRHEIDALRAIALAVCYKYKLRS